MGICSPLTIPEPLETIHQRVNLFTSCVICELTCIGTYVIMHVQQRNYRATLACHICPLDSQMETVADPEGGTWGTCPPLPFLNSLSQSYNLDSKLVSQLTI